MSQINSLSNPSVQIDSVNNYSETDQGNNPQSQIDQSFDQGIPDKIPNFSDFIFKKEFHQTTWKILNEIKAIKEEDLKWITIWRKKIEKVNEKMQKFCQDNLSQSLQKKLFDSLQIKDVNFIDDQNMFIPLKDGEIQAIQVYYHLVDLFEKENNFQKAEQLINTVQFQQVVCYYSLLENLEFQTKFIELSGLDYENLKDDKEVIFLSLQEVINLENQKQVTPDSLQDLDAQISSYVKDLIEVVNGIENQQIKLYIKEILLKTVQERALSVHFYGLFEEPDDSQILARIQNPQNSQMPIRDLNREVSQIPVRIQNPENSQMPIGDLNREVSQIPVRIQNPENSQLLIRDLNREDPQIPVRIQNPENSQIPVRDLNPEEFKDQFFKGLQDKLKSSELTSKYVKYLQNVDYFIYLFTNMTKWVKEIYPNTQKEILEFVNKIIQQLYNFLNPYKALFDENLAFETLKDDFQKLYELEISHNDFSQDNQAPLTIFNIILDISKAVIPDLNIQEPKTLNEQQIVHLQKIVEKLPRLPKNFTILDCKTIDGNQDVQAKTKIFIQDYQQNKPITDEKLIQILFDLVKQQQNFSLLVNDINKIKNQVTLSQFILQVYLLEHADYDLKVLLCRDFSQFMPMPLAFYNPWSQSQSKNLQILDPIYYIFEKSQLLMQFKLPKFEKTFLVENKIKGCTHLLNKLFGRDFSENENNNLINNGQVEIQFDQDCANVEHMTVVDVHGFPNFNFINKIFPLADGFIIHQYQDYQKEYLMKLLQEISNNENAQKTVVLIQHNSSNQDLELDEIKLETMKNLKIYVVKIKSLISREGNVLSDVINQLHNILGNFFNLQSENYKKNPKLRLLSKKKFQDLLKNNGQDQNNLYQDAHDTFSEILDKIMNETNLKGKNFLPMMNLLKEKKQIEEKICDEYCSEVEKTDGEEKLKLIYQKMGKQEASKLTKIVSDSINKKQCLKLLPFLSSVLKDYLEAKNKILNQKKEVMKEEMFAIQSNQINQSADQLKKEISEITNQIENNFFSIEMIFSEIQNLAQYSKISSITPKDYLELIKQNDKNAQPQQLIDGESLICNADSLKQLEEQIKNNEDLSVFSVIGPQSSGKSLLLNKIFGTSFLSASGRCTKGVYFSIIRYKDEGKMKKILILDTEGIQSIEGKDGVFDKRLIYFAIGVSHAVFICNQKEMNAQMSETIELVAEAISETKTTIIKDPSIFIVLNMCTNVEDETILQGANLIKEKLQEMAQKRNEIQNEKQKNYGNSMILIKSSNILKLGQAFNKIPFGPNNKKEVHKPNYKFSERTNEIKQMLTKDQFERIQKEETTKLNLTELLSILQDFWQFSKNSRTLSDYPNLHHKQIDTQLMKFINGKIKEYYSDDVWNTKHKQLVINKCDQINKNNKNANEVNIDKVIFREIELYIQNILQIDDTMLNEYKEFCKAQKIDQHLMDKRIQFFNKAKDQAITRAFNFSKKYLQEFVGAKTKLVGQNSVREHAKKLLSGNNIQFTPEKAKELFRQFWPTVQEKVKDLLKDHQEIQQETLQQVIFQFQSYLSQTLNEEEKSHFNLSKFLNEEEWLQIIMQYYFKQVLIYSGNKYGLPKIQEILNYQTRTYEYLDKSKTQLFESKVINMKLEWWSLLQSILNLEKIISEIKDYVKEIVDPSLFNNFAQIGEKVVSPLIKVTSAKQKLEKIIKQFQQECQKLGFIFELDVDKFLKQIEIYKQRSNSKISQCIIQILTTVSNFDCQEDLDLFRQARWNDQMKDLKFLTNIQNIRTDNFIKLSNQIQQIYVGEKIIRRNTEINISIQMKQQLLYSQNQEFSFEQKRLESYLNFMINNQKETSLTDQQASSAYFFTTIKWKEVFFKKIQQIIIFRFHQNKQTKQENSIQRLIQNLDKDPKKVKELGQIDQEHALSIVQEIRSLIYKLNQELLPFRMEISDKGETFIFLIAQIYTQLLVENLEILRQNEVLEENEKTKVNQEEWFIANLTNNNTEEDKVNGKTTAIEINQFFIEKSNNEGISYFQQEMEDKKKNFERLNFLNLLQTDVLDLSYHMEQNQNARQFYSQNLKQTYGQSEEELKQYYIQPQEFLKKKMDAKIKELEEQVLPKSISYQMKQYKDRKDSLIKYLKSFKQNLKEVSKSSDLFELNQQNDQQEQFQQQFGDGMHKKYNELQKVAKTNYLYKVFKDEWNNQQENIVEDWKFIPKGQLPLSASLKDICYYESTCEKLAEIINKVYEISDLQQFIQAFIETLEKTNPPKELSSGILMGQKYHDFRKIFIGCFYVCPMCRKQCDIIHQDADNMRHNFDEGQCHQFQGFGGNKAKTTNYAITYTCNDLKDEQIVNVNGNSKQWIDLKSNDFKDWNFNQGQSSNERAKQVRIWNFIGQDLCNLYNKEKNLGIKFDKADDSLQMFLGQAHLILMLDSSGSMGGSPWNDLIKAVSSFLYTLESNQQYKTSSKITCITFSNSAQVSFAIQSPSQSLLSYIKYIGDGTDFSDPFEKAYNICVQQNKSFDKTVLYFMTDGQAEKPESTINKFRNNQSFNDKLSFYAVGYGQQYDKDFLANIALRMKGKSVSAPTGQDLENIFDEIISNVFGNDGSF